MAKCNPVYKRKAWRVARALALERDKWRCRKCERPGILEVDHIVPLKKGGAAYDLKNLQTLCRPCHFDKTAGELRTPLTAAQAEWRNWMMELVK